MKRLLAVLLSMTTTWAPAAQEKGPAPARKTDAEIVAALAARMKALAASGEFSGAVLLAKGDQVLFREAVGLASREDSRPNTPDTKFNLGSINKAFTRLAIEQLAAEGKLAVGDTIDKYVPEFPVENGRRITIAQLLDHRGGTGDFFGPQYDAYDHSRLRTLRDWLPLFASAPLEFEPGARQRYSNAGYLLLGLIIEKVSGQPYEDYVRERIFTPAGMADTAAYPIDAAVANRARGYTREGEAWIENTAHLPWRGTSAGGGFSTVDDLRRFADALRSGKLGSGRGALGIMGGGKGVNAALDMQGEYTLVVLANLDPPAATRLAGEVREWLPEGGGMPGRRRVMRTSDGSPGLDAPRTSVVPANGASVPMKRHGHLPAVEVMVNGQGPFLFAIDTGAAGTARVDAALAERLGLKKVGEALGGDPSGRNARSMAVVAIESLQIGAVRFEGVHAAVRDMRAMPAGEKADGILGFGLFREALLTLDYPGNTVRMSRGALPPANGRDVLAFTRDDGVPTVSITVGGREMSAHVDAGFMGGISLAEKEAATLPLAGPLKVVGRGRTPSNTFEVKAAPLAGDVRIGDVVIERPTVDFQPVFAMANVGARVLRDFVVTFDQANNRMQLVRPER
jgi:CubicO group peptidase (beta-lactamase class C family)